MDITVEVIRRAMKAKENFTHIFLGAGHPNIS
jgi:hypothetical protein